MTGYYTVPQGRPYARLRFGSTTEGVTVKFSDICVRDLTDPMNYRGKSGGDGKENSLNKKFDTVTYKTTQSPLATITRQAIHSTAGMRAKIRQTATATALSLLPQPQCRQGTFLSMLSGN